MMILGNYQKKTSKKDLVDKVFVLEAEKQILVDEKLKSEYEILREKELLEKKNTDLDEEAKELIKFLDDFASTKEELENKLRLAKFEKVQKLVKAAKWTLEEWKKKTKIKLANWKKKISLWKIESII